MTTTPLNDLTSDLDFGAIMPWELNMDQAGVEKYLTDNPNLIEELNKVIAKLPQYISAENAGRVEVTLDPEDNTATLFLKIKLNLPYASDVAFDKIIEVNKILIDANVSAPNIHLVQSEDDPAGDWGEAVRVIDDLERD